jgi:hypothetical protein
MRHLQFGSPSKGYVVLAGQQQPRQQPHALSHQGQQQSLSGASPVSLAHVGGPAGMHLAASFHAEGASASNGAFSPNALFEQRQKLLEEQVPAVCLLPPRFY